jgi:hypothetical protein
METLNYGPFEEMSKGRKHRSIFSSGNVAVLQSGSLKKSILHDLPGRCIVFLIFRL